MDNQISVWLLPLRYGFSAGTPVGLGVRYQKELVPQGFIHWTNGMRDEFGLEGGVDYVHSNPNIGAFRWSYNEFDIVVGAVWNFWVLPELALYPKVDLGVGIESFSSVDGVSSPGGYGGFFVSGAVGAAYRIADRVLLRAEVGNNDIRVGVGFNF